MAVYALLSAGGSPGVTTAALALTLGWPSRVILAEFDPSGGDVLAGLLGGHMSASAGLLPLALESGAGTEIPGDLLWRQLVELDEEHNRLLLAGISDPRQFAALQSSLPWVAEALQAAAADVIADCGRLDSVAAIRPVLSAASLAVLVLAPTLRQVSRAVSRVEMVTSLVGPGRVVLLLAGEGGASAREISRTLGVPVAGQLPDDPRTAALLSDGSGSRRRLEARPLIRAAAAAGRAVRDAATTAGPLHGYGEQTVFADYPADSPELAAAEPALPGLAGAAGEYQGLVLPQAAPLGTPYEMPSGPPYEIGQPLPGYPAPADAARPDGAAYGGPPYGGAPYDGAPHGGAQYDGAQYDGAPYGGAQHGGGR